MSDDLGNLSMLELFATEVDSQGSVLNDRLLELEQDPANSAVLESLMRAAHSLKGAARMVDVEAGVRIAHVLEDVFTAALAGTLQLQPAGMDQLLKGVDLLREIGGLTSDNAAEWFSRESDRIDQVVDGIAGLASADASTPAPEPVAKEPPPAASEPPANAGSLMADPTMLELFRGEAEAQTGILNQGLLELEADPTAADRLEALMRAAHSVKGAARMVGVEPAVALAHGMEDVFVAAQKQEIQLSSGAIDRLLNGVDLLARIGQASGTDSDVPLESFAAGVESLMAVLEAILKGQALPDQEEGDAATTSQVEAEDAIRPSAELQDGTVKVSTTSLNRLMGLAGEVQVESRWLHPFGDGLVQVKHRQSELISLLDRLAESLDAAGADDYLRSLIGEAQHKAGVCRHALSDRLNELEEFDRRSHSLANRLNQEVVKSRMRPFADGVQGFQRMVRDLSRSLNKQVKLEFRGLATQVDRDILAKIEAPLNHLLRNAIDHGIEAPEERAAAGKPEQATIVLEAVHSAGMLSINIRDDGRGIDPERLRNKVVDKGLSTAAIAANLTEAELMEFLFLPGFSTRQEVTEISGRGVGLDVVHSVVQEMRGVVRATTEPGKGMQFHMQLPLTLSVVRALLVEIAGQPYAFPLARIDRTLKLHRDQIEVMEGRQYFTLGNHHIGLVTASQVLELPHTPAEEEEVSTIVLGERVDRYGLVVDRFLGERSLVVQPLDQRLGKVRDINAAAILEDGTPCLIADVDDLLRSVDILIAGGRLDRLEQKLEHQVRASGKRVLVVDDSITVREVERNMLVARGYDVDVAVDGMDGWNAVRTSHYDLVISDIDMPRMNGFEFVELIKQDDALKRMPVMIVSYKDREEDRARGLEVGADYYLTKGSFHDETLLEAVVDLIGEAN